MLALQRSRQSFHILKPSHAHTSTFLPPDDLCGARLGAVALTLCSWELSGDGSNGPRRVALCAMVSHGIVNLCAEHVLPDEIMNAIAVIPPIIISIIREVGEAATKGELSKEGAAGGGRSSQRC